MHPYGLLTPGKTGAKITRRHSALGDPPIDLFKSSVIVPALVIGLVGFVTLAGLAIWKIPQWQVPSGVTSPRDRAELEDQFRRTMSQIVAGAFILIGATATGVGVYYTARRVRATERTVEVAQEQQITAQEGQITERFTRAIEQLGNEQSMAIRLGGIYALERIARDSPKDHWQVMEVLTAYVRENARWEGERDENGVPVSEGADEHRVPTDIQAILTVLGRREVNSDPPGQRLDLSSTDLRSTALANANLWRAGLDFSNLQSAYLGNAILPESSFTFTNVQGAYLGGANLLGAYFNMADLQKADLQGASLLGANVLNARLTQDQIDSAIIDANTILPD